MTHKIAASLLVTALASGAGAAVAGSAADLFSQAMAVTPDAEHGKILYLKHCRACHGAHAWGDGPREIPALAGQRQRYVVEQLAWFATGERQGSEMHGPAMQETLRAPDLNRPQAIGDLAAYLSHAARNPRPDHAEGHALEDSSRGVYTKACSGCHGGDGEGSDTDATPGIGGQHYGYLLAQLRAFASGRSAHPAAGIDFSSGMSAEQQRALADYISRLPYLTSGKLP